MTFKVYLNNVFMATLFAPNYETAYERAVREWGDDVVVEEN